VKISANICEIPVTTDTGRHIYDRALEVLKDIGIEVDHAEALKRISRNKTTGVTIKGNRVYLAPSVVSQHLKTPGERRKEKRDEFGNREKEEFKAVAGGYSFDVYDSDAGRVRPATMRDLIDLLKLCDSYDLAGPVPVVPQDIPIPMRNIATHRYAWEYSRYQTGRVYDGIEEARIIYDMHKVVPGASFRLTVCIVNPLKVSKEDLDVVVHFIDMVDPQVRIIPLGYGMHGMTHPMSIGGSHIMSLAEKVGTFIVLKLIRPDMNVAGELHAGFFGPIDFRNCNYSYGNPTTAFFYMTNRILHGLANGLTAEKIRFPSVGLVTGSCEPDEQAAIEKASTGLVMGLLGTRNFAGLGNLCVDDIFSAEQLVIDMEIVDFIEKVVESYSLPQHLLDMEGVMESIQRAVEKNEGFLTDENTVRLLRNIYKPMKLFEHMKLHSWMKDGKPLRAKALAIVEDRIRNHDYRVDEKARRELETIYKRAEKVLLK